MTSSKEIMKNTNESRKAKLISFFVPKEHFIFSSYIQFSSVDECLFCLLSHQDFFMLWSMQVNALSQYLFASLKRNYWTIYISDSLFPKSYCGF